MGESLFQNSFEILAFTFKIETSNGQAALAYIPGGNGNCNTDKACPASLVMRFAGGNGMHCCAARGVPAERICFRLIEAILAKTAYTGIHAELLFVNGVIYCAMPGIIPDILKDSLYILQ